MDFRHLKYFTAVAQQGSFTKAAEVLHVSQPTLSKMVRLLEEELDCVLFDRSAKSIKLTDAGQTILRSSLLILKSMDNMTDELNDLMMLQKGTLRLGIPPMVGGHFFSSIIERFHSLYPNIQMKLVEQGGKRIEADIESGELDAGLVILPVEAEDSFHYQAVMNDKLMLVTDSSHRLAGRERVELKELEHESLILFREEFRVHHLIKDACRDEGFEPEVVFESSQWDFMTEMVSAKLGITLLPKRVCLSLDRKRFSIIQLERPVIPWRLSMIWSKHNYISFAAREWISFVQTDTFDADTVSY